MNDNDERIRAVLREIRDTEKKLEGLRAKLARLVREELEADTAQPPDQGSFTSV